MSWKYVPFAGFFLFAFLLSTVGYFVLPGISPVLQLISFGLQYLLLVCIWIIIRTIARFLDKRISYRQSFSRRVFFQITISILVFALPCWYIFDLLKPRFPVYFTPPFLALAWILLFAIIVLMNVSIAAGYFFSNWQKTNDEKTRAIEEKKNMEMELLLARQKQAELEMRALRAQMNPHFIFNSLNSINKYILKNDQVNASKYLTRFAKLIRLILDNSNSKEVALSDELEALKLYIEMEALRFTHKFAYEIIIDESVMVDTLRVPPLIFQPYVENAIWHGLLHKQEGGKLSVSLRIVKDDLLECIIDDNGIGRSKAKEYKSKSATANKSLGMQLTEERIKMLNRSTSLNASLQIIDLHNNSDNEAEGTRVIVTLPV